MFLAASCFFVLASTRSRGRSQSRPGMHEREKHKNISTFSSTLWGAPSCELPLSVAFSCGFRFKPGRKHCMPKNPEKGLLRRGRWLEVAWFQLEAKHLSFNPNCCQQSGLSNILFEKILRKSVFRPATHTGPAGFVFLGAHTHTQMDENIQRVNKASEGLRTKGQLGSGPKLSNNKRRKRSQPGARSSGISMKKRVLMWDLARIPDGQKGLKGHSDIFTQKCNTCSTSNQIKIKAHEQTPFRCISHLASWTSHSPPVAQPYWLQPGCHV